MNVSEKCSKGRFNYSHDNYEVVIICSKNFSDETKSKLAQTVLSELSQKKDIHEILISIRYNVHPYSFIKICKVGNNKVEVEV